MITLASRRLRKHSTLRQSSRKRPLKHEHQVPEFGASSAQRLGGASRGSSTPVTEASESIEGDPDKIITVAADTADSGPSGLKTLAVDAGIARASRQGGWDRARSTGKASMRSVRPLPLR